MTVIGKSNLLRVVLVLLASAGLRIFAQEGVIFGAGNVPPSPILYAAPGQLVILYVTGIGSQIATTIAASTIPLPTQLGEIQVTMTQSGDRSSTRIPILSISPQPTCLSTYAAPCGTVLAVVVQIPFSLILDPVPVESTANQVFLVVSDKTHSIGAAQIRPAPDSIHLGFLSATFTLPAVTHADKTPVNVYSPAKPGEELVIYATGLGYVSPLVPTGKLAPSPASVVSEQLYLNFEYRANANAYVPPLTVRGVTPEIPASVAATLSKPLFAGLVPGSVGAYQINFTVPSLTSSIPSCDQYGIVSSNLTVTVFSGYSADAVGICVDASAGLAPSANP